MLAAQERSVRDQDAAFTLPEPLLDEPSDFEPLDEPDELDWPDDSDELDDSDDELDVSLFVLLPEDASPDLASLALPSPALPSPLFWSALAAVRPAVGPVEAAPFERHADVAEDLPQRASAGRAFGQGIVLERLDDFEVLAAALQAYSYVGMMKQPFH